MSDPTSSRRRAEHWISVAGADLLLPRRVVAGPAPTPAQAPAAAASPPAEAPAPATPSAAPAAPVSGPEEEASVTDELGALAASCAACTRCGLHEGRRQAVFADGSPGAEIFFVGEGPGAQEDEQGVPFVGPAGQLLTRIIENAMGLPRADVYIANVVKCRPPQNRNPSPEEQEACGGYLEAQIRAIRPKILVCLGAVAAQYLLRTKQGAGRLRGQRHDWEGIPVVVTWHPAYLLRNPAAKRQTWEDVQLVLRLLGRPERPTPYRPGS